MARLVKQSLLSPEVYESCLARIAQLNAERSPQWGKMNAAQMLAHCAEVLEVTNGKELKNTPFIAKLFKGLIRKAVLNDQPYPKNSRTHPQYIKTDMKDFEREKQRLLAAMQHFTETAPQGGAIHPLFGEMTPEEKGWGMYKHLDHHLQQFGV